MPIARLYSPRSDGCLEDLQHDIDLAELGGVCPAPGDRIVASAAQADGTGGTIWEVVQRYFQPRGLNDYVVLVVDERPAQIEERDLLGSIRERRPVD